MRPTNDAEWSAWAERHILPGMLTSHAGTDAPREDAMRATAHVILWSQAVVEFYDEQHKPTVSDLVQKLWQEHAVPEDIGRKVVKRLRKTGVIKLPKRRRRDARRN